MDFAEIDNGKEAYAGYRETGDCPEFAYYAEVLGAFARSRGIRLPDRALESVRTNTGNQGYLFGALIPLECIDPETKLFDLESLPDRDVVLEIVENMAREGKDNISAFIADLNDPTIPLH